MVPRVPLSPAEVEHACCSVESPQACIPRRVMKGGSHLCAPNYCQRYRPAARMPQPIDTSTSHLGFRTTLSGPRDRGESHRRRVMGVAGELTSWRDGPAKQAIVAFVAGVSGKDWSEPVPVEDRLAVFDNDGTL